MQQTSDNTSEQASPRTVIIGGGLAGIAAAVRLAGRGVPVTLLETRKRLGGRATSFVDPDNEELLDNCQHVLMGCCTNLIELYSKLDVSDLIEWHSKLYFGGPHNMGGLFGNLGGRSAGRNGSSHWVIDEFEADDLPAPMHMTNAMMQFRTLTLGEKAAIGRGMLAMMRLGREGRAKMADITFLDWLKEQNQPDGAIQKFWAVVIISALNELPELCSAAYALQVFQEGFLANEQAYVMGLSRVPLVKLYDPARIAIENAGGQVILGAGADRLMYDGQTRRITGVGLNDGRVIEADTFISAVPFDRLGKLSNDASLARFDVRLRRLDRFTTSPILGIHLWFESAAGKVMDIPHVILMDSPLQWIFNKGFETGEDNGHAVQHLHGVISACHDWVDQPADAIMAMVKKEVARVLPGARDAELVHARVVKEKRATFSVRPGIDRIRPPASPDDVNGPAIENLFLCGDWCDTGWPATMEGAVRSGNLAAAGVLKQHGDATVVLAPDLAASPLYQFVAG